MKRYTPDPSNLPTFSVEERARLDAMTDEEIEAAALSDRDNPPLTDEQLARMRRIPLAKVVRRRTGLTQQVFATVYGFSLGRLRDLEQGRTEPDSATQAYLHLIRADPKTVRAMLDDLRTVINKTAA